MKIRSSSHPDTEPHEIPRKDRRAVIGLFAIAVLVSLAAFAYVFVLASDIRHESDVTHNGICALLAQAAVGPKVTAEQMRQLTADDKLFACALPPSTVRKPK